MAEYLSWKEKYEIVTWTSISCKNIHQEWMWNNCIFKCKKTKFIKSGSVPKNTNSCSSDRTKLTLGGISVMQ